MQSTYTCAVVLLFRWNGWDSFFVETFGMNFDPASESDSRMSGCAKVALGCGVFMLIASIMAGIGVWWIAANARQLGADVASSAMKEGIEELQLPPDQQQRITRRIDDVAQQFKNKQITLEQVSEVFSEIGKGPLNSACMALVVERVYLDQSGFDEEERTSARTIIQRFSYGTMSQLIPEAEVNMVLDMITAEVSNEERDFKYPLTDAELRAFISAAEKASDEANVPAEVPEVNFADEFDKAVDQALGNVLKD